jgi:hypothetical protein
MTSFINFDGKEQPLVADNILDVDCSSFFPPSRHHLPKDQHE